MDTKALPYGLRDVKLTPLLADGTAPSGSPVDLPASQTLSFKETEEFKELRGDDQVQAARGGGPVLEWDLEAGGISLDAYAVLAGGTVEETGVTPNAIRTFRKLVTDSRPYFKVEGQAMNDNGGDFHGIIYRCKVEGSIDGKLADQEFLISSCSGKGYGSKEAATLDALYDFIQNETATDIVTDNNEIQMLIIDATAGQLKLTVIGQQTGNLAFDISAAALKTAIIGLSSVGDDDVDVVLVQAGVYQITFIGALANTNITQITVQAGGTPLSGGSATASVYTAHAGG